MNKILIIKNTLVLTNTFISAEDVYDIDFRTILNVVAPFVIEISDEAFKKKQFRYFYAPCL